MNITTAVITVVALTAVPLSVHAQESAEAGVRLPATWASGKGAPTVRTAIAPLMSLNVGRPLGANTRFSLDTRLSNSDIRVTENDRSWSGGTLTLVDVIATIGWRSKEPTWSHWSLEGGAGLTVFAGSRNVAPLRDGATVIPVVEGALAYDLPWKIGKNPVAAFARGTLLRIGGANVDDAVREPGTVHRLTFGARVTR